VERHLASREGAGAGAGGGAVPARYTVFRLTSPLLKVSSLFFYFLGVFSDPMGGPGTGMLYVYRL